MNCREQAWHKNKKQIFRKNKFSEKTNFQKKQIYRKNKFTEKTNLQKKQIYRKNKLQKSGDFEESRDLQKIPNFRQRYSDSLTYSYRQIGQASSIHRNK